MAVSSGNSGSVSVNAVGVHNAGTNVNVPAGTLHETLAWFKNQLAILGEPWGDDEIGQQFWSVYSTSLSSLLVAVGDIDDGLEDIRKKLANLATMYGSEYGLYPQ